MAQLILGNVIGPAGPQGEPGPAGSAGPNLIDNNTLSNFPAGTLLSSNGNNIEGKSEKDLIVSTATKATQDGNGLVIADTYATKADTYTKEEVDIKVSSIYKYKGSVPTFVDLPKENISIGDVYNVEEDNMNYAWDGKEWDSLGSTSMDLNEYLKKVEAESTYAKKDTLNNYDTSLEVDAKIKVEADRAKGIETALDSRLKTVEETGGGGSLPPENYYTKQEVDDKIKVEVPTIKVFNSYQADKDSKGNIIVDTYASKANVYNKDEVDAKVASVYKYKGSVETYADLPTVDRNIGDVYDVQDTGNNYAWDGAKWDSLGMKINLTEYLKKNDAAAIYATQASLTAEINRSTAKDNEIDGKFNDYALKENTISSAEVDNKIKVEENRASMREDAIDNKFTDYTKTSELHLIKVDNATNAISSINATKAETAIKATQDSNGSIISDTYMKKADTYTRSEIDDKVSAVYKYKGSVSTYANLPKTDNKVGDVWDVQDTGTNYAWNGAEWDSLGTGVDLSTYLKIEDATKTYATKGEVAAENSRSEDRENELNAKFNDYTTTEMLQYATVNKSNEAVKATQDGKGNVIDVTYAKDADLIAEADRAKIKENEIDSKFSNYQLISNAVTISDIKAEVNEEETRAVNQETVLNTAITTEVGRASAKEAEIEAKFKDYRTTTDQSKIDNNLSDAITAEMNRAKEAEKVLDEKITSSGGGGGLPTESYYTKTEIDNKLRDEVPNIKVNEAVKATQDGNGNVIDVTYATKAETVSESKIDEKINVEKNRAESRENAIESKFVDYATIESLVTATVEKAGTADSATKATQDGNGLVIADTYATKETTYTKEEVDGKVSSVYKYKNSVKTYADLPKENNVVGDVYDVQEDGMNYAWNGTEWDRLGGTVDLSAYMRTDDANKSFATKGELSTVDGKFADYTTTEGLTEASVKHATTATQDAAGNVITITYAKDADVVKSNEIDRRIKVETDRATGVETGFEDRISALEAGGGSGGGGELPPENYYTKTEIDNKFKGYTTTSELANASVKKAEEATKATQDSNGKVITVTYATKNELSTVEGKFADYTTTSGLASATVGKANEATKTAQDGNGNIIVDTYATKETTYTKDEVDNKISSVYKYKGSVANYSSLPAKNQVVGDVYNVEDTGANYAWDGKSWDQLGMNVDLGPYQKTEDADAKYATQDSLKTVDNKFALYTKTDSIKTIKVNNAIDADNALKASQDAEGNVITTHYAPKSSVTSSDEINSRITAEKTRAEGIEGTLDKRIKILEDTPLPQMDLYYTSEQVDTKLGDYATKETTYTKDEVDGKISSVYKYKGSVANYEALPKADQVIGDVYNVEDTGDNYAWDGKSWDKLAGTVNLTEYLKKDEASSTYITPGEVDTKLTPYAKTESLSVYATIESLKEATVKKAGTADSATKATQDAAGNVITTTYAKDADLKKEAERATGIENGLADRISAIEAGGGGSGPAPDLKEYLKKTEAATTYATISSVETVDAKFKDYATIASLANASVNKANEATKALQDGKGNVIENTYATQDALSAVDGKFADYVTSDSLPSTLAPYAKTESLSAYATTESLKEATVKKAGTADSATKATQDGDGNVISATYVKTNDLATATVQKAGTADEATKATQDGAGNVITDTYATKADTYTKEEVDTKLTAVYKFKGSVANYDALPKKGQEVGDVYDTLDTGTNYAWTGTSWDSLGGNSVDLSAYLKTEDAAKTYATQDALNNVDAKFAGYTPSTEIHSIIVDTATKAMQDGNGAIITDTYVSNDTLTTKLGDYATTASLADATVKKSGETDSITNVTVGREPWTVNFNPKGAANNPANFLWFDVKNNQIRNANTKSLNVNHSLKATQDNKGNVIDTFYAKGADLTALDERVTAIEAGGGGGTGPDLKEYLKSADAAKTYATIETVTGIDDRVTALEAGGGGGGTAPDLKDYYKKTETYSQKQVDDAIKVETDRATGIEDGLEVRVKALEDAPSGGGTSGGGGGLDYPKQTGNVDFNNPPAKSFFLDEATYNKATNSPKAKWTVNGTVGAFFKEISCGDIKVQEIILAVNADTSANFQRSKPSKSGAWTAWGKAGFNPW